MSGYEWRFPSIKDRTPHFSGDLNKNLKSSGRIVSGKFFIDNQLALQIQWFAREFLQNSVDEALDGITPVFKFRFVEFIGEEKEEFIKNLGLSSLEARREMLDEREDVRKRPNCLDTLEENVPLRVLFAEELGTGGMVSQNTFTAALLSNNVSNKSSGKGGGYGIGKSVNGRASKPRFNIVYTHSPEERCDEDGVTRRLLGVTYWGTHQDDHGEKSSGMGYFDNPISDNEDDQAVNPYVDDAAIEIAEKLGFSLREDGEYGTSFMFVDPEFEPEELKEAIERFWWPGLADKKFKVLMSGYRGEDIEIAPHKNEYLKWFVEMNACLREGQETDEIKLIQTSRCEALDNKRGGELSLMKMPVYGAEHNQGSVVAIARGIGMVVHYKDLKTTAPAVQGFFKASSDEEVQELLKIAEPPLHDKWDQNYEDGSEEENYKIPRLVKGIYTSITKEVREYSDEHATDELSEDVTFSQLNKNLKSLIGPLRGEVPPSSERGFKVRWDKDWISPVSEGLASGGIELKITQTSQEIDWFKVSLRCYVPTDMGRGDPMEMNLSVLEGPGTKRLGDFGKEDLYFPSLGEGGQLKILCETKPFSKFFVPRFEVDMETITTDQVKEAFNLEDEL